VTPTLIYIAELTARLNDSANGAPPYFSRFDLQLR
jgi:hypothetical protein